MKERVETKHLEHNDGLPASQRQVEVEAEVGKLAVSWLFDVRSLGSI